MISARLRLEYRYSTTRVLAEFMCDKGGKYSTGGASLTVRGEHEQRATVHGVATSLSCDDVTYWRKLEMHIGCLDTSSSNAPAAFDLDRPSSIWITTRFSSSSSSRHLQCANL